MWYFAWLLGLPVAVMFGVINAMWFEMQEDRRRLNPEGDD
ncbi:cytochrome bd-I oxidase subunit CydX [Rhodobacter sp. TJ_12]|nr:cytochrome bd-I oxidase subunit CydX [Rhodobacter sp. TJ_12]MBZ4021325.1 cytochrome bd-I oxidase subunit CydX [Rhodobacter sp. TJ_12]